MRPKVYSNKGFQILSKARSSFHSFKCTRSHAINLRTLVLCIENKKIFYLALSYILTSYPGNLLLLKLLRLLSLLINIV